MPNLFTLVSDLFFRPIRFFENLNFYFMKTANIPVYGNIAMYITYCAVCLYMDFTLRCLEYICSVSSPLRRHGLLMVKTQTNELSLLGSM